MCKRLLLSLLLIVLSAGCAKKVQPVTPQAPESTPLAHGWRDVHPPLKPTNIAAIGDIFWLCGTEETIASSSDGGNTWKLRHKIPGGRTLLSITFLNETMGHAGGEGGLLLSTVDGGQTWVSHDLGPDTVQAFSFSDAAHGIAVLSGRRGKTGIGMLDEVQGTPFLNSTVKLTHDGGQHWEDATSLKTDEELRRYTEVLSVAALDPTHYLIGIRQPQIAVGYAVTSDAGRLWKLVHLDDVYATRVFVHDGEYWAFGIEYLDREKGGGYSAPVSLHSKDGENWVHGLRGPNEFPNCNFQGCYLSDGVVENLYGQRAKFWVLPRDGTMTKTWAIAGNFACMVAETAKCGLVEVTEEPPAR